MDAKGKTHFEELSKAGGNLLIKEQFKTPAPKPRFGKLVFKLQRLTNVRTGESAHALHVVYTDSQGDDWIDLIDAEEIPSLISAAKECVAQRALLPGLLADYIEFLFSTRSGFGLGMYHSKKSGDSGEWIEVAGVLCFLRDLSDLIAALERASVNLDRLQRILDDNAAEEGDQDYVQAPAPALLAKR